MNNKEEQSNKRKKQIMHTIAEMLPQWKNIDPNEVKTQRLSGITNQTYKVSHPSVKQAIIYREFGDASDNIFLNRKTEQYIYEYLSSHRMGPKILGLNGDVRLQEFIDSHGVTTSEMLQPKIIQDAAYALRQFHTLNPDKQLTKQSLFTLTFFDHDSPLLSKCLNKMAQPIFNEQEQKKLQTLHKWVTKQQIKQVKNLTKEMQASELVFSHNDLLCGNILVRKKDSKVIFIDYEYSCFNYPIYDIANYFVQATFNYDVKVPPYFGVIEPTQHYYKMQDKFMRSYAMAGNVKYHEYKEKLAKNQLSKQENDIYQNLKSNLLLGKMLSQLMWGWWGIIVSKNPNIQFDYISFSYYRYQKYTELKEQILKHKKQK